jgi:organic hydroperoxide reductase OsmC/OhrA
VSAAGPPSPSRHRARVRWRGDRGDLRAHVVEVGDQAVGGSAAEDRGGDPAAADPEELLVAALSACHMLWFLDFARRRRLRVGSYEDAAEGELGATRFTRVVLRPAVSWEGEDPPAAVVEELHRRAHEACFIANSMSCPVLVEPASAGAGTGR